jgi:putative membrane protein
MNWHSASYHMQTIALWGIVIVLTLLVAASAKRTSSSSRSPAESPEQILKRRYAAGEIDRETYQRMLADLHHGANDRSAAG